MKRRNKPAGQYKAYYNSPIGLIEIIGTGNSIAALYFIEEGFKPEFKSNSYLDNCVGQLDEYFNGKRKIFEIKLELEGTEFQKKVWNELLNIQYGETKSYLH